MKTKVAVIEDDPNIRKLLVQSLKLMGYLVLWCDNGKDAVPLILSEKPDVVILDWNLPQLSGLQVCTAIRSNSSTSRTLILMLTVFHDIHNKVDAFKTGVDDYMTKPFQIEELQVRIEALMRRTKGEGFKERIECGKIRVDMDSHTVTSDGNLVRLRPKEFELLRTLLTSRGRVITRQFLKERVWGYGNDILTRTIDTHVAKIRGKLGAEGSRIIQTIPGYGYKIDCSAPSKKIANLKQNVNKKATRAS